MLVENNKKENDFAITEAVFVTHLGQAGTVVGHEGSKVRVKLAQGGTILCEKNELQKRQVLLG